MTETNTPKPLCCVTCKRRGGGKITCRVCSRKICKHYAKSVVDLGKTEEQRKAFVGKAAFPVGPIEGTCSSCSHAANPFTTK